MGQFVFWLVFCAAVLGLCARLAKRGGQPNRLGRAAVLFGPQLLPIFFLHAVLFRTPFNFAVLRRHALASFFRFWFTPYNPFKYGDFIIGYVVLVGIGLLLLIGTWIFGRKAVRRARGSVLPLVTFVLWYASGVCVHSVLAEIRDEIVVHRGSFLTDAQFVVPIATAAIAGLILALGAIGLTLYEGRRRAQ